MLAQAISTLRAPKSSEGYRKIGGGSPLRRITQEQADALEEALRVRGQDARVYVGMRYWYPFMEDAIAQARARPPARPAARQLLRSAACTPGWHQPPRRRVGGLRKERRRSDGGVGCPFTCQRAPSRCKWADASIKTTG